MKNHMKKKKIVLTGGGTAGHVTPNIALLPALLEANFEIFYIGTKEGIEFKLISKENIPFYPIKSGKLRRYFDLKNFSDVFWIIVGFFQSLFILIKIRPNIVFSKGGFVSCPVVWAGWFLRIPIIIHESDITIGLANRLSIPFAKKVLYSFPEAAKHLQNNKAVFSGLPVRRELLCGNPEEGKKICNFTREKPVILIMGGSSGSLIINKTVKECLRELLDDFNVCHICGKSAEKIKAEGYCQFEYVTDELPHLFSVAALFVGRAGATTLFELLLLKKPMLLIPLSTKASRGDQILNASSFKKQGFAHVLMEENLSPQNLVAAVKKAFEERENMIKAMNSCNYPNAINIIMEVINSFTK